MTTGQTKSADEDHVDMIKSSKAATTRPCDDFLELD